MSLEFSFKQKYETKDWWNSDYSKNINKFKKKYANDEFSPENLKNFIRDLNEKIVIGTA